ncbi:glycoprotein 3-alpha-L-fucosyltransferase A-like [Watersipora subatra]|uniref:glycoprotein 3-alpha-L-fucosyltransferase A-like n=1 Tax=Watersipora subatra TaxID=2589382 RepID=UPI00355C7628
MRSSRTLKILAAIAISVFLIVLHLGNNLWNKSFNQPRVFNASRSKNEPIVDVERQQEAITLPLKKPKSRKLIVSIDKAGLWMIGRIHFDGCEYSNCDLVYSPDNVSYALQADALAFFPNTQQSSIEFPDAVRQRQLWFVFSKESPAYPSNRFKKIINSFNGSMTYSRDSVPAQLPYGYLKRTTSNLSADINYAYGKTKGAYAYVSHCSSKQYDRLHLMQQLKAYINVDIFGNCTNNKPCPKRIDPKCEAKAHSQYRFYLAFENSLCKEYITEKFWKTLRNEGYFIPIALGGLSVQEYNDVAPPDSFIHVYNFSSVETLGKYLQYLMTDDAAFNRYFEWRSRYSAALDMKATCALCKSVNDPESLRSVQGRPFADEWNNEDNCKDLTISTH